MTRTIKSENSYQKRKKNKLKNEKEKKFKILNSFLVVLILLGISYYVATVNDLTIKGLKIRELKQEVSQNQEQNRDLTVRVSSLKSYKNLVKRNLETKKLVNIYSKK